MAPAKKPKKQNDAFNMIFESVVGKDTQRAARIQEKVEGVKIAEQIYHMRKGMKLSQKELADKVGTTPSVISRLEDADYDGYSLTTLRRMAKACKHYLQVRFEPQSVLPEWEAVEKSSKSSVFQKWIAPEDPLAIWDQSLNVGYVESSKLSLQQSVKIQKEQTQGMAA